MGLVDYGDFPTLVVFMCLPQLVWASDLGVPFSCTAEVHDVSLKNHFGQLRIPFIAQQQPLAAII